MSRRVSLLRTTNATLMPTLRLEHGSSATRSTRSVAVLRSIIAALNGLGVESETLLRRMRLDVRGLRALPERVPIELHNQVWEEALRLRGDPRIGVHVAAMLYCEMYDVVGGIVQHSATLGDAVVRLARFGHLLGVGFDMRLEVDGDDAILKEPHYPGPLLHLQGILCQLLMIGITGRRLTGLEIRSKEIRVIPARPSYAPQLESYLETPIRFGATHNALVFPSAHLHLPVRTHDSVRVNALEQQALSMLQAAPPARFGDTVEALLALGLAGEGAEAIAARLDITPRTLARRLEAEGTSFRALREGVRRRLAESYLRMTSMSSMDIAISLGFSDETAFARAFRRWTGASPMQYRAQTTKKH